MLTQTLRLMIGVRKKDKREITLSSGLCSIKIPLEIPVLVLKVAVYFVYIVLFWYEIYGNISMH